jgi:alpha-beta hydrolase superfamily lysophospholipase
MEERRRLTPIQYFDRIDNSLPPLAYYNYSSCSNTNTSTILYIPGYFETIETSRLAPILLSMCRKIGINFITFDYTEIGHSIYVSVQDENGIWKLLREDQLNETNDSNKTINRQPNTTEWSFNQWMDDLTTVLRDIVKQAAHDRVTLVGHDIGVMLYIVIYLFILNRCLAWITYCTEVSQIN